MSDHDDDDDDAPIEWGEFKAWADEMRAKAEPAPAERPWVNQCAPVRIANDDAPLFGENFGRVKFRPAEPTPGGMPPILDLAARFPPEDEDEEYQDFLTMPEA